MASASFTFWNFRQDHTRLHSKEFQTFIPAQVTKQEVLRSDFLHVSPTELVDLQKSNLTFECSQLATPAPTGNRSVLIDAHDNHANSVLFSFGIAEQCIRREKILQFLASGSNVSNGGDLDVSLLSDIMGLHSLAVSMQPQQHTPMNDEFCLCDVCGSNMQSSFGYSHSMSLSPSSLVNFGGGLSCDSTMMMHPDGQVLFMGSEAEIKALLSTMAIFYISQSATAGVQRHQMVVPYFTRSGPKARSKTQGSAKLQTAVAAPLKSMKAGTVQKKRQKRKTGLKRDTYKNNYSQVCESLLSVILFRKQNDMTLYSLKKHGHELPELLTQFSAGIAGAGLAALFCVFWKLTNGRVPLCTAKLLNTGFGVGMVWLSLAVNMLRDTIIEITKHANKLKLKEDEMTNKIERSVKEVLFRAAAVMAVVILRLA